MSGGSGARVNAYTLSYIRQQQELAGQAFSRLALDAQSDAGMDCSDPDDAHYQEEGDIEPFQPGDSLTSHEDPVVTDIRANPVDSIEAQDDDDYAKLPEGAVVNTKIFDSSSPIQIAKYHSEAYRVLEMAFSPGFDGDLATLLKSIADKSNFEVCEVTRLRNKPVSRMHEQFKLSFGIEQTCVVYHGTGHADVIARVGFRGAASRRAKHGRGIYSSTNVFHALAYGQLTDDDHLTFLVVQLHLGPIALGREDQVDFGQNSAGEAILTLTNLEGDIYCASQESQHLATYKVTVRYMFENPTTLAHNRHVNIYSPEVLKKIQAQTLLRSIPFFTPAPAPAPAASNAVAVAVAVNWVWEETTHKHYSEGQRVEITGAFKPRYAAFVGFTAVVHRVFAKRLGQHRYKEHTFFLEVQGKDADETAELRKVIERLNYKCFTDFLRGDDRALLPCRPSHMRFFIPARHDTTAASKAAADQAAADRAAVNKAAADHAAAKHAAAEHAVAASTASKRPRESSDQDSPTPKRPRDSTPASLLDNLLDLASTELHKIARESREIAVGDNVQITKICFKGWYPESFVGFQGVVQSIRRGVFGSTCFVELTRNQAGEPVTQEQISTVEDWNRGMYGPDQRSFMKCNVDYLVLADPKVPPQQKTPPFHSERLRPRHSKYDPTASPPWAGGDVKPFLYGRRVTFILQGRRGEPITR